MEVDVTNLRWLCPSAALLILASAAAAGERAMVDHINPMIGASTSRQFGEGKTFPGAATPFGLVQLSPDTITGGDNGPGYSYHHKSIEGFSFTHMSGIGWYGDLGNLQVMPTTGPLVPDREKTKSPFSHDREDACAGYYSVMLDRYDIRGRCRKRGGEDGRLRATIAFDCPATRRLRQAGGVIVYDRSAGLSIQNVCVRSIAKLDGETFITLIFSVTCNHHRHRLGCLSWAECQCIGDGFKVITGEGRVTHRFVIYRHGLRVLWRQGHSEYGAGRTTVSLVNRDIVHSNLIPGFVRALVANAHAVAIAIKWPGKLYHFQCQ